MTLVETETETVNTYADSFGVWHARVTFPEPGYGPAHLEANNDRIRAKARRAIRREIAARQGEQRLTVRVHVVDIELGSMNRMESITYAERRAK